ncbi:H-NS histone family protein [Ralstonia pseudosolanacearum]
MATLKELLKQKAQLDEQIEVVRQAEVAAVIQQVRDIVEQYGLSAEDIGFKKAKKTHSHVVMPKYLDPKTGATWSGRGRAPAWIGKNRDRFLINK